MNPGAVPKRQAPETVPLRFVLPLRPFGKLRRRIGFHRPVAPLERQRHRNPFKSARPRADSSGFHKSPIFSSRRGTLRIVKSSMRIPRSTSFQVTGVETVAAGLGLTEYTEAKVLFQAFWL